MCYGRIGRFRYTSAFMKRATGGITFKWLLLNWIVPPTSKTISYSNALYTTHGRFPNLVSTKTRADHRWRCDPVFFSCATPDEMDWASLELIMGDWVGSGSFSDRYGAQAYLDAGVPRMFTFSAGGRRECGTADDWSTVLIIMDIQPHNDIVLGGVLYHELLDSCWIY